MISAVIVCASSLAPIQVAHTRPDVSFEMELVQKTTFQLLHHEEVSQTAYKGGAALWRLVDSETMENLALGYRRWEEGSVASSDLDSDVITVSLNGSNQGQPPPLVEEVIAGIHHPYRLDPRLSDAVKTRIGKVQRVTSRHFGVYVVTADYHDDYEGMLWNYSVTLDGKKPSMSTVPDQATWEFREPAMVDGRWYASQVDIKGQKSESRIRVKRLSFTTVPGVEKPDWMKGKTSVIDTRFEPSRKYLVADLRRRFKSNWPPSLLDLYEYGEELGGAR